MFNIAPLEVVLLDNLGWSLGVWLVLYLADYYLTVWGATLYRQGANEHVVFEGSYELTPQFREDIDLLRRFSPRFFRYVLLSVAIVSGLWYVAWRWPDWELMFLVAYGGLVFRQIVVLARHARNIALFRRLKTHGGVEGCIRYATWLSLEQSSVELFCMSVLLLAAGLTASSTMLYGGAFAVCVMGLEHCKMARKARREAQKPPPLDQPADTTGREGTRQR
jgi:hypothetical protein